MKTPGSQFESEIVMTCDAYDRAGLARIKKVDPPTRMVNKGGRWIPVHMRNPFLDFIGTMDGRFIMLETKLTTKPRLDVREGAARGSGISDTQLSEANAWAERGAVVLFLWKFGNAVRLTTPVFLAARCRKSITWDDAFDVPPGTGFVRWDFLPAAKALSGS